MKSFIDYLIENEEVDADKRWITIKKRRDEKGRHVLINKFTSEIVSGLGNKFNGKLIDDIYDDDFEKKSVRGIDTHKFAKLPESITDYQKESLYLYTEEMYTDINGLLRGFIPLNDVGNDTNKLISDIDTVMENSKTTKNIIVYRGLSENLFDKLEIGASFKDKGFSSTTSFIKIAKLCFNSDDGILMEVRIPKGSRAISVMGVSKFKTEKEILIDRNTTFTVTDIKDDKVVVEISQD